MVLRPSVGHLCSASCGSCSPHKHDRWLLLIGRLADRNARDVVVDGRSCNAYNLIMYWIRLTGAFTTLALCSLWPVNAWTTASLAETFRPPWHQQSNWVRDDTGNNDCDDDNDSTIDEWAGWHDYVLYGEVWDNIIGEPDNDERSWRRDQLTHNTANNEASYRSSWSSTAWNTAHSTQLTGKQRAAGLTETTDETGRETNAPHQTAATRAFVAAVSERLICAISATRFHGVVVQFTPGELHVRLELCDIFVDGVRGEDSGD